MQMENIVLQVDGFQGVECLVCHDLPQEPKLLTCKHTFCQNCLTLLYQSQMEEDELSCPDCRQITYIQDGDVSRLQTNADIQRCVEAMQSAVNNCTVCEEEDESPATAYCQTCKEHLCESCLDLHAKWKRNANHEVVNMEDIKSGYVKMKRYCPKHPQDERECICTSCGIAICFRCRMLDHNGPDHRVEEVSGFKLQIQSEVDLLQKRAQEKMEAVSNHLKLVAEESAMVELIMDERMANVNQMYKECVRELTEKRNKLVESCQNHKQALMGELLSLKKSDVRLITVYRSASELVGNGTRALLEGQALTVHSTLCCDLREMLSQRDPSDEQPRNITKGAENVEFRIHQSRDGLGAGLGEVILNNWSLQKINEFPLAGTDLYDLVPTLDGKMAVGYMGGGIELFSVDGPQETVRTSSKLTYRPSTQGGRRSSKTVLEDKNVGRVGVLSDGRFVVLDEKHNISMYTPEWKKVAVEFETLHEGGFGGMGVDRDDKIYVGYWHAKKILVFDPEGGAPIREIPCQDYEPVEICPMHHTKMLVVRDLSTVRVVDERGVVKYNVNKEFVSARMAVLRDDSILIGWVKDGGLLSLDLYTHQLKFVTKVLTDFNVVGEFRMLREFSTGELALCDDRNFYVFEKSKL